MLGLQGEQEAGSEAINLLYAGNPGRVVDVVLQVAVGVGDDVVQAGEHQPRAVETSRKSNIGWLVVTGAYLEANMTTQYPHEESSKVV